MHLVTLASFLILLLAIPFAEAGAGQCTYNDQSANLVFGASTFNEAGLGGAGSTSVNIPWSIATNGAGNQIYVSDNGNNRVLRYAFTPGVTQNGAAAQVAFGQSSLGGSTAATTQTGLNGPIDIAFGARTVNGVTKNYLWVLDQINYRAVRYDAPGGQTTSGPQAVQLIGQSSWTSKLYGLSATNFGQNYPSGMCYDSVGDKLWIGDSTNNRMMRWDGISTRQNINPSANAYIGSDCPTCYGDGYLDQYSVRGVTSCEFDEARNILYVVSYLNHRVLRFDGARNHADMPAAAAVFGQSNFQSQEYGVTINRFLYPTGVAVDSQNDVLYVVVAGGPIDPSNRVMVFRSASLKTANPDANLVIGQADFDTGAANQGQPNPGANTLDQPNSGDYNTASGWLWVADTANNRVLGYKGCVSSKSKSKSRTRSRSKSKSRSRSHSRR